MKAIWLACCACGDYGLLQREVEGRDVGAQVLRVGDLDGLVSMARAFPSRRGAAIIAASLFDTEDVRNRNMREESSWILRRIQGCTACVCYNDEVASNLAATCLEQKIKVPDKISRGCFARGRPRSSLHTVYAATGARARERLIPIGA